MKDRHSELLIDMIVIHVYTNIYCNIMEEISHMKMKNQINRLYYTYTIYIHTQNLQ